jgi:putative transposase
MVLPESSTFCKDEYALKQDNVIGLKSPGVPSAASDALTDLLRDGARQMLAAAVEAEVQEFLVRHQTLRDDQGRQRVVRNGYLPQRTIQTGLGDIDVKAPRVRDRAKEIKFSSSILPPYLRRTKTIEELLPWLYLKGVSTGDFSEADGPVGARCTGFVGLDHQSPEGELGRRARALGQAQSGQ